VTHRPTKPSRAVDRNGDFSLGIIGGSYVSGYETGGGFGDMGLGITAEYRPLEAIGLELSTTLHDESWDDDTQRINRPTQASVNLYAFPWTRVSPYVTTGLTWNKRSVQDTFFDGLSDTTVVAEDTLFGPHAGLGIEFALGENASINFDGTYTGFLNISDNDPTLPVAVQGTMGLNVYF